MSGEPGSSIWKHSPVRAIHRSGYTPYIRIVMSQPPLASVHLTGSHGASLTQILYHGEKRLLGFIQTGHFCRPVIHLSIDIDGVFAVPWGHDLLIPYTLQVGRLTSRLGRTYQKISSVIVHESNHGHIVTSCKCSKPLVGRKV